jgi:hypothetical protein
LRTENKIKFVYGFQLFELTHKVAQGLTYPRVSYVLCVAMVINYVILLRKLGPALFVAFDVEIPLFDIIVILPDYLFALEPFLVII